MNSNRHPEQRRPARAILAFITAVLALALAGAAAAMEPPTALPKGAIIAFLPDPQSAEYSDTASLKAWLDERGFALCDGTGGTPDLNFRMLLGTVHAQDAGSNIGSRTHDHRLRTESGQAQGRERSFLAGRGERLRVPDDGHRHRIEGSSEPAEHLPLSLRVLFIMKVR